MITHDARRSLSRGNNPGPITLASDSAPIRSNAQR